MGHNGFRVDLGALADAEEGIRGAVSEIGGMAGWGNEAMGKQGMGLKGYALNSSSLLGNDLLGAALIQFGQSWEWGIRYLVEDGQAAVDALGEARGSYQQMDGQAVQELLRGAGA
ncbi:hypothetical protein [Saccharopolyspora sp. NPDC002686]|uniref:hypothetical protein n=1 Tax=Saccharopolyspora sp. NPDC002686 TaxID=3154541 RepID=UPI003333E27E